MEGRRGGTIYVIGDHLFIKDRIKIGAGLIVTCMRDGSRPVRCRGRAYLDEKSLRIIKEIGEHICVEGPGALFSSVVSFMASYSIAQEYLL